MAIFSGNFFTPWRLPAGQRVDGSALRHCRWKTLLSAAVQRAAAWASPQPEETPARSSCAAHPPETQQVENKLQLHYQPSDTQDINHLRQCFKLHRNDHITLGFIRCINLVLTVIVRNKHAFSHALYLLYSKIKEQLGLNNTWANHGHFTSIMYFNC